MIVILTMLTSHYVFIPTILSDNDLGEQLSV